MTEKAILFARVSTEQQDLERQKEILIPKIKEDGFTDDDIIIIEHKESAIKNDFYSRDGIEELKEKIENEKIKAVYATELSRLGRRNDVILKVWGLLEEKKICLVIQSPTQFRTIDKDGKQSLTGSILMGIMQQVSISEMEIKKERMMSGIKLRKERGYLAVSRVKFGYKRDINNRAEIDEEKAEIVRQCFDLCLKGDSCGLIYKKFNYLAHWNSNTPNQKISKLLRDKTYIGENDVITYPRIIDDDTFYKVQEALKDRRLCKHKTKFTYYCQKLIHWNGRTFTPCYSNATYHLRLDKKVYSLSVNCLDAMTKNLAINAYAEISQMDAREERDSYLAMIDECDKKIEGIELGIRNIENKIFRFMEADFSDEEMIKKTEEKIKAA